MNNKILDRDEFVNEISQIGLSEFACLLSINDKAFEIAAVIAEKANLSVFRLDKLKKNPHELEQFNLSQLGSTILMVTDVSASGRTLDEAKALLHTSIQVKTFAISGKADYCITNDIICSTQVVNLKSNN